MVCSALYLHITTSDDDNDEARLYIHTHLLDIPNNTSHTYLIWRHVISGKLWVAYFKNSGLVPRNTLYGVAEHVGMIYA